MMKLALALGLLLVAPECIAQTTVKIGDTCNESLPPRYQRRCPANAECQTTGGGMGAGGVCVPTLRPCPYKTMQEMQTALAASGCNNMAGDCSAKCAHRYMPLTRECKTLIQQSNLEGFTRSCVQTLRPDSGDRETGRQCFDGKDNDGDGVKDCQDKDCAHYRGCRRQGANQRTKCTAADLLPALLECQAWTRKAEQDGQLTVSDGFCTSSCHGRIQPILQRCKGRMPKMFEEEFDFVAPLLISCDGSHNGATNCNLAKLHAACGNNVQAAMSRCNPQCTATIDYLAQPCKTNAQFKPWARVADSCADSHDDSNCASSSSKFLSFVDKSCCRDTSCKGVPKTCTVECAATFMPYFSRCGRTVFGSNRQQLIQFEKFNRKCAVAMGRNVKDPDGTGKGAQLDGPDPKDICSHTKTCTKCNGGCGWCAAEVKNKNVLHKNGGGWCSSQCVTTNGECRAHGGVKKETGALCFDHKDDDGDGSADCDDSDCQKDPRAQLLCKFTETGRECFDGKDNDGDGHSDCADQDCLNDPLVRQKCRTSHNTGVNRETGKQCFDGIDNDHDGRADCDDWDCKKDPRAGLYCMRTETGQECFDGRDNDRDGKTDCQDPDCLKDPRASTHCHIHQVHHETGKLCFNGIDDDHDGKPDCRDPDCFNDKRFKAKCTETGRECFDGRDNDGDGKSDCSDPDCLRDPTVRARCTGH